MNLTQFKSFAKAMKEKNRMSIYMQGPPGGGKSATIAQIVEELGLDYFMELRLGTMDVTETRGIQIPVPDKGITIETLPHYFPTDPNAKGILFLDEFDHAVPAVQSAAYQLVYDLKVGSYQLPEGITVIMASNSKHDGGVHFRVPEPIKNRVVQVYVKADLHEWLEYAKTKNVDDRIIYFIRENPQLLYNKDNDVSKINTGSIKDLGSFATPRSWFAADEILSLDLDDEILLEVLAGTVGVDNAKKFLTFITEISNSLDANKVLSGDFKDFLDMDLENHSAQMFLLYRLNNLITKKAKFNPNLLTYIKDYIPADKKHIKASFIKTLTSKSNTILRPTVKDKAYNEVYKELLTEMKDFLDSI